MHVTKHPISWRFQSKSWVQVHEAPSEHFVMSTGSQLFVEECKTVPTVALFMEEEGVEWRKLSPEDHPTVKPENVWEQMLQMPILYISM